MEINTATNNFKNLTIKEISVDLTVARSTKNVVPDAPGLVFLSLIKWYTRIHKLTTPKVRPFPLERPAGQKIIYE